MQGISNQDPDKKLKYGVDFPDDQEAFTPFLHTELRVEPDGSTTSRLYRKPQQKKITLHQRSHHPTTVKNSTLVNLYREADKVSSNKEQCNHSFKIIDDLLKQNGYIEPRKLYNNVCRKRSRSKKPKNEDNKTILKLEFVSDSVCNKIRNHIKVNKLPINVTFTPGPKLSDLLCSNRPYDKNTCVNSSCKIFPLMVSKNKNCQTKNIVYKVKCKLCREFYVCECFSFAHDRLGLHLRDT